MNQSEKKAGFLSRIFQSIERARVIRQLEAMTDRDLRDIGVSRSEIHDLVHGRAVYRAGV